MNKFKKLKELYGSGGNFYSGKDLGTHTRGSLGSRGADSNFSRLSQAIIPHDAFTHFLDEDEDEEDESDKALDDELVGETDKMSKEDYIVVDSKYKLAETLNAIKEAPTLEMMPDPDDANIFLPMLSDTQALATTKRAAAYYGLELGFEGAESIVKMIPGAGQGIDIASILFNLFTLQKSAGQIYSLDEKFSSELENLSVQSMSLEKEKYIQLFTSGIREIETHQASMYDDFGDLFQSIFSIIPWEEALGLGAGGAGAAVTGPGGLVTGSGAYTLAKVIDGVLDVGLGVVIEQSVRMFIESYEDNGEEIVVDQASFDDWLRRNDDDASSSMKITLTILKILEGPLPKVISPGSALRALFVGANLQNKLIKLIKQLQNPHLMPDEIPAAGIERFTGSEEPDNKTIREPVGKDSFLRKLFVSYPSDSLEEAASFENCLYKGSLLYLVESEEEVIKERPRNVRLRVRGDADPKGFSSGVYEDNTDKDDDGIWSTSGTTGADEDADEEGLEEFSGSGAAGGVAMKLGHEADGTRTTQARLDKKRAHFRKTFGRSKK